MHGCVRGRVSLDSLCMGEPVVDGLQIAWFREHGKVGTMYCTELVLPSSDPGWYARLTYDLLTPISSQHRSREDRSTY